MAAAEIGQMPIVEMLLEAGSDVNTKTVGGPDAGKSGKNAQKW